MNSVKYTTRFFTLALIIFFCQSFAFAQKARLRGAIVDDHLKLYWETYDWTATAAGFNLKRKNGANGAWDLLNKNVIYPQADDRNWSDLGLNQSQTQTIRRTFQGYLASGDIKKISKEDLIKRFHEIGGLQSGDRLRMKEEYAIALIYGFGYIDNTYKKSNNSTYGLFAVDIDGRESPEPIALFSPEKIKKINPQVDFNVRKKQLSLSWKMLEDEYFQAALVGFRVYRYNKGNDSLAYLRKTPIGYLKSKNGNFYWEYIDESANPELDYIYHLIPVTLFQSEYKAVKVPYSPGKHKPIDVPGLDTVTYIDNVYLKLTWATDSISKSQKKRIKKYYLEKASQDSLEFKPVFTASSGKVTSFTDTSSMTNGKTYFYRLGVIDANDTKWEGDPKVIIYSGFHLPQKPTNLKAEFKIVNGNPFVLLSWDKPDFSITKGYYLETDELESGTFLKPGSIPLIRDNNFLYPVRTFGGKKYQFRITPTNGRGTNGDTVEISCWVPMLLLPPFSDIKTKLTKENTVEVTWQYPENVNLTGFRILLNNKEILSKASVKADQRKVTIENFTTDKYDKLNQFSIEAIGEGAEKISLPKSLYIKLPKIKQVDDFKSRLYEKDGDWFLEFAWNHELLKKNELKGFRLYVDQEKEGDINHIITIKNNSKNTYTYSIPDPYRDSYTFHIAAISRNGEISPSSEIIVNLDKQKKR
jgi:hypothetical protein